MIYYGYLQNDWAQYVGHSSYNEFTKGYYFSILGTNEYWNNKIKTLNIQYKDQKGNVIPISKIVCQYRGKNEYGHDSTIEKSFDDIQSMINFSNDKEKEKIYFLFSSDIINDKDNIQIDVNIEIIDIDRYKTLSLNKILSVNKERLTVFDDLENGL